MASVVLGGGVVALAGSIGGTTFARSRAGPYARGRSHTSGASSDRQRLRHHRFSRVHTAWLALTDAQRSGWHQYAQSLAGGRLVRKFGVLTGYNAFVAANAYDPTGSPLGILSDPPTALAAGFYTAAAVTWFGAPYQWFIMWMPLTESWRSSTIGLMISQVSRPRNADNTKPANHWRNLVVLKGDPVSPPAGYWYGDPPWIACHRSQSMFFRCRQRDEFGRLGPWRSGPILVT